MACMYPSQGVATPTNDAVCCESRDARLDASQSQHRFLSRENAVIELGRDLSLSE
jgi:hypothetical protein